METCSRLTKVFGTTAALYNEHNMWRATTKGKIVRYFRNGDRSFLVEIKRYPECKGWNRPVATEGHSGQCPPNIFVSPKF